MPLVVPVLTFLVLIVILSTLRARLVYELSATSLLMFGNIKPGTVFYSLLVLPGTIIHELSHWLTAEILRVRTGEITILPELKDGSETERLGSVATERTDPIRGFLIGVAPFLSGLMILLVLGRLLELGWGNYLWWQNVLIIYGIMVTGNSMMISQEDRKTWPVMIIVIAVLVFGLNQAGIKLPESSYPGIRSMFDNVNLVLGVTAGFNLVMIGGSYALRRLIEKVTGKRIARK